jgi:hypothetical protein
MLIQLVLNLTDTRLRAIPGFPHIFAEGGDTLFQAVEPSHNGRQGLLELREPRGEGRKI